MAKEFNLSKMQRGKSLSEVADKIDNLNIETKQAISEVIEEPTKDKVMTTLEVIKNDTTMTEASRNELIKALQDNYVSLFNFNNCPNDYESIKSEVKFFSSMLKYNFLLIAHRLVRIRDGELYKQDGYNTFKDFIENELHITKRTVYDYIDIVSQFGPQLESLDNNIEYSKLSPIIPLLKAKNNEIPKEEIRNKFIEEVKIKSQKELREEAKLLKIRYGLAKEREEKKFDLEKNIYHFIQNCAIYYLDEKDKEKIRQFIKQLEALVNWQRLYLSIYD